MEENNESVYSLITKLCQKLCINGDQMKTARSHCYEVLLGKKLSNDPRKFEDLKGTTEPTVNLLAWCYELTQYDFGETAQELNKHAQILKESYGSDVQSYNGVITFLLCLKDVPKKTNANALDWSTLPNIEAEMTKFNNMFKLPSVLLERSTDAIQSTEIFKMAFEPPINTPAKSQEKCELVLSDLLRDEGYSSPNKESIWDEVVSQLSTPIRYTWESYGCGPAEDEKPFLSELGDLCSLWVENLESLYICNNQFPSYRIINNQMKPRKVLIRDLKLLLVGVPSDVFLLSNKNEFFIASGIMVEGITPDAMERYCSSFILAGTCYKALNHMSALNPTTRKHKYPGYVFAELCESICRYLQFYHTAVISIHDNIHFLDFHEKTRQIQAQVTTLATICKVGPSASETEQTQHGVVLLNYLYQKVLGLSDKNLCNVLYSILYPCCQIYFSRFLHQWLIKGTFNDPHGEFFVNPTRKYLTTRCRTYWTRSYEIKEDIVPDFLVNLKDQILVCGRLINLLQLCNPGNNLCACLIGKNPLVLTCCITRDKLTQLEQSASKYYLEASMQCGSKFSFTRYLERSRESDITYLQLIAKKRAVTLRRLELERQKSIQEQHEMKLEELLILKEQYECAVEQKQLNIYKDIERNIRDIEEDMKIDEMREQMLKEEAVEMIDYYTKLGQLADMRKQKIYNHIRGNSHIQIDDALTLRKNNSSSKQSVAEEKAKSSSESFYSAPDEYQPISSTDEEIPLSKKDQVSSMHSSESMDLLNANTEQSTGSNGNTITKVIPDTVHLSDEIQQAVDNFETARKIKQKVLNQELGITNILDERLTISREKPAFTNLTDAQRNKLKVLSSEFGINVFKETVSTDRVLTTAQVNKNKVMGHNQCFVPCYGTKPLDNDNYVNRNMRSAVTNNEGKVSGSLKKSTSLHLDFDKIITKCDTQKALPMSVDSTPMSDIAQTASPLSDFPRSATFSSIAFSTDTKLDSITTNGDTLLTQTEGFGSVSTSSRNSFTSLYYEKPQVVQPAFTFSKKVTLEEANNSSKMDLTVFLHESLSIPLMAQLNLANNEILKYFVEELRFLDHLESLRDYFFLQDGEFGRSITENLFEKLYSANFPLELINGKTLQHLVFGALDNSNKYQQHAHHLSFKINSLPKCFDLNDPDVLDCLSLTYKVKWPLNILLPSDVVNRYDRVFKFLLKVNRVSWVMKKLFMELKILAKETGEKEIYLMSSAQYRRLHQCRHIMSHFVQTLQNYIVGDVLQPSWSVFENNLANVSSLDELYEAHNVYIKDIIFRCMLHQKSVALRNMVHKIFVVILKFYYYLKSRRWKCENGSYVHPNFHKLEKIFENFEDFMVYFFKVVKKVAKSGYQPYLAQFLHVLDVNDYYSKKLLQTAV
ncbi:gamma-tubulin complex component 6 [Dendroctonus ponderosae]|uniref:gamma-tubulin complex component 6 n=1 Tax=Dendroctonus ponderosae TaxID=77166 RepID=UPI002035AECE|nr:gamma-tubulin complex component 6 [Dendroctonus ponderosae]